MNSSVYSTTAAAYGPTTGGFPQVKEKTRNLSTFDYLEVLQTEYVVAQVRKKIYPHKKDKAYYERTMEHKRTKIEDIASRNSLPTIFNDTKVKDAMFARVLVAVGFPNFHYKNEEVRAELEPKDFANYYSPESEVKVVQRDGTLKFGELCNANLSSGLAYVLYKGETQPEVCSLSELTRIL
jgi:hypothetical protein